MLYIYKYTVYIVYVKKYIYAYMLYDVWLENAWNMLLTFSFF